MTGAPIPEGADGVIMQERTDEGSESVEIYQSVASYGNYCKEGERYIQGSTAYGKGRFGTAGWSTAVWYMPGKMERLLKSGQNLAENSVITEGIRAGKSIF